MLKRQPDYHFLEYYNMAITILLSGGCMCCPYKMPILPPLLEYSQAIHANSGSDATDN